MDLAPPCLRGVGKNRRRGSRRAVVRGDAPRPGHGSPAGCGEGAGEHRSPAAFEALAKAVTDLSVRPYAVDALGRLKDRRAVPILIDVVSGKNRPANARKVPVCGDESGELDVEEMEVQIFAIGGLSGSGGEGANEPLIRALKDTRLRAGAASALSKMGLRIAAPLLAAMKTETDSNILFHARGILSAVGWRPAPTMKEGV